MRVKEKVDKDSSLELKSFKKCPGCHLIWESRDQFLVDPDITLIGYQVNYNALQLGLFLFNHKICKTTLALYARDFKSLSPGPIYKQQKINSEECPDYCLHESILEPFPVKCECAYVRDIMHKIRNWKK
jgi:hypothetical protein